MEQNPATPQVLTEKDAARYIGMSVAFLRADRMNGHRRNRTPGPTFVRAGRRIIYLREDLDAWLRSNRIDRRRTAGREG